MPGQRDCNGRLHRAGALAAALSSQNREPLLVPGLGSSPPTSCSSFLAFRPPRNSPAVALSGCADACPGAVGTPPPSALFTSSSAPAPIRTWSRAAGLKDNRHDVTVPQKLALPKVAVDPRASEPITVVTADRAMSGVSTSARDPTAVDAGRPGSPVAAIGVVSTWPAADALPGAGCTMGGRRTGVWTSTREIAAVASDEPELPESTLHVTSAPPVIEETVVHYPELWP